MGHVWQMKAGQCVGAMMRHMWKSWGKKVVGVLLILIGIAALVTPLTPGAWLAFVGLEFLGVRLLAWDRVKAWLAGRKEKPSDRSAPHDPPLSP